MGSNPGNNFGILEEILGKSRRDFLKELWEESQTKFEEEPLNEFQEKNTERIPGEISEGMYRGYSK